MDAAERIAKQKSLALSFLGHEFHFEATSAHPSWQGKIKCKYCKARGWVFTGGPTTMWWGNKHGRHCKWKELWDLKNSQFTYTGTISTTAYRLAHGYTYATNTSGNSFIRLVNP